MKQQLLLHTALLAFHHAHSQAVLLHTEMLPPGGVMTMAPVANFSVIDTTIQGANAVWDFSALAPGIGANLVVTIALPASTPYGVNFPTANYAYVETPLNAYRYFAITPEKAERVGSYYGGTVNTYNDPQIEYVYPMQLGTTSFDTWDNTNSSSGGTYGFNVIGTGTLQLPAGQWNDVLMTRVHQVESGWVDIYAYFWYDSNSGAPLVQYIPGDGFLFAEQGRYQLTSSTAITENGPFEWLNWSNPVQEELWIETVSPIAGKVEWNLVSATGGLVRTGTFAASGIGADRWTMEVDDLASGIHVLTFMMEGKTTSLRFIKN